jgi:hypothetical protein
MFSSISLGGAEELGANRVGRSRQRRSFWRRLASVSFAIALLIAMFSLALAYAPHAAADSSLVQQSSGSDTSCPSGSPCSVSVSLPSSVTSGNVVLVEFFDVGDDSSSPPISVTDTLSSSYSPLVSNVGSGGYPVAIYAATLASGGSDVVTVADSSGSTELLYVYVFEVSGVTTAQATTAPSTFSGPACTPPCSIQTSSDAAFSAGAFLLAAMVCYNGCTFSGGTGFTVSQDFPYLAWEYATAGVSSSTNFPATLTTTGPPEQWLDMGVALQPSSSGSATTTTVTSTVTVTEPTTTTVTDTTTSVSTTTATATITQSVTGPTTTITQSVTGPTTTITHTVTGSATTIVLSPTQTSVSCSPTKLKSGQQTTCTATVTNLPSTSTAGGIPTGTVSFASSSSSGTFSAPSCATSGSTLMCTATYGSTAAGTQTITASYSGDGTHTTSQGSTTVSAK